MSGENSQKVEVGIDAEAEGIILEWFLPREERTLERERVVKGAVEGVL